MPASPPPRGTRRFALALLGSLGVLLALSVLRAEEQPEPVPTQRDLQAEGLPVEVARVQRVPVQRELRLFGTVEGSEQAEVVVPAPNVLEALLVEVGQDVRRGQVLARMRDVARSPLGYPYGPLEAQLEALRSDQERMEALHAKGAITDQQYEHFQAQLRAAEAQFASAEAGVRITAPIAGTVTRIDYRPGQVVPPDRPLLQLARLDPVVASFELQAVDVPLLRPGQELELRSSALPGQRFRGRVLERDLGAYPVIGGYHLRVEVPNPDRLLLPGFPVEARLLLGPEEPVLAVPPAALVEWEGRDGLWAVGEGDRARFVPVEPGIEGRELLAVSPLEGAVLEEGQRVVTLGADRIRREGQPLLLVGD